MFVFSLTVCISTVDFVRRLVTEVDLYFLFSHSPVISYLCIGTSGTSLQYVTVDHLGAFRNNVTFNNTTPDL